MNFKRLFILLMLALAIQGRSEAQTYNPKGDEKAVVRFGNARFTVLTDRVIRMEWSNNGGFEDNATLTFVNRLTEVPQFTVSTKRKSITIATKQLTLTYNNTGSFNARNLTAEFELNGQKQTWHYGDENRGNLLGTTRTLDGCNGNKLGHEPMEQGLISRDGWALIDDSHTLLTVADSSEWREWVAERTAQNNQDLYLFVYGHDYKAALADYSLLSGRAPMPPKYTFGYWWSRYWQYSDSELRELVDHIKSIDMPIDVLIVDMDWHETWGLRRHNSPKDEFGQRIGWTGYTWQKELFPSPDNFLKWAHNENLKVALNLHPASGIQPMESVYEPFVKEYGWTQQGKAVPFKIDERKWADAYFKTVLGPMEQSGVDFWWLDWQQWVESKYTKGLSNTFWLNHTFFNHAKQAHPSLRPFIYHRWGGLGSHRYPLAFSGDTYSNWATLAFLPYFTATASNVNYGYWGHDIGGHMYEKEKLHTNPELYTRWLQYGVFTPIFKTHSTKDARIERYIWLFPDYMFTMRDAVRLRYTLVPYIYNASRQNYDSGVAMCRPMYYDYPDDEKAYQVPEQFMFGDDILATVVAEPVDSVTGLARRTIWFPKGEWFDMATGTMYEGNTERTLFYTVDENPWFAKAGAIIPMNPSWVKNLQEPCNTLVLTFVPGGDGQTSYYEDDGISQAYTNTFATTLITKRQAGNTLTATISQREGSYEGAPLERNYRLRFPATFPPVKVLVNGVEYPYSRFPKDGEWGYEARSLSPVVYIADARCDKKLIVELAFDQYALDNVAKLYGKSGIFGRCERLTGEFKAEQGKVEPYLMLPEQYLRISQCANFIQEYPSAIGQYIEAFDTNREQLFEVTDSMQIIGEQFKKRIRAMLGSTD